MRRPGVRLPLLFLLVSLSSLLAAESFTDCFSGEKLDRFWESQAYLNSNSYIYRLPFVTFYSFAFDNSTQGLGAENLSLAQWDSLASSLQPADASAFKSAASSLSDAAAFLNSSQDSQREAHRLSLAAQASAKEYSLSAGSLASLDVAILSAPFSPSLFMFGAAEKLWSMGGIINYVASYPQAYAASLSGAASAYDSLNSAALSAAQAVQVQYSQLEQAGAGSPLYSGAAKETFMRAQAMLAGGSPFCSLQRSRAQKIADYFEGRPALPDFWQAGFGEYLQETGGRGANSSLALLVSEYSELEQANAQMRSECESAELAAKASLDNLSEGISSLDKEDLQLIGDSPAGYQNGSVLSVGTTFSGIERGLSQAKSQRDNAQQQLSLAGSTDSDKGAQGYLALAISEAGESQMLSQAAADSLSSIRSSAEAAVAAQRSSAAQAIAKAGQEIGAPSPSISDANAVLEAQGGLQAAKDAFSSADFAPSLGKKYAAYSLALQKAGAAISMAEGRQEVQLSDSALQQLSSLRLLLSNAQADGLDVSFESQQLSTLESLLRSEAGAPPESTAAIISALQAERSSVLLRLAVKYSDVYPNYVQLGQEVGAMRTQDPSFLPAFDPLAKYFNSSGLDAEVAAGSLCAIESQLSSLGLEADRRLPYYLSFVLSKNAVAQETLPTPVLGQPDEYHLSVSTANPTQFSYSGQLRFQVRSSVPVYSSDFVSGDAISDAYPNGSAAVIALDGVQAGGSLAFNFQKAEQPAQITSSQDSCALSSQDGAQVVRSIAFSSSRSLDYLGISELASSSASDAYAQFGGSRQPLQVAWAEGGSALQGRIGPVSQGRNSLSVGFSVSQPFAVRQGARSYTLIGNGSQQVSFVLSLENVSLDCSSAQIEISEPFAVSGFSALPLAGGGKVSQAVAASSPSGSQMSFLLSPLAAGSSPQVAVSYVVSDPQLALSEALQQAQLQVLYYNRSSDALALSEAESLSAQNRSEEALSLLSAMLQQGQQLSAGGFADYRQFLDENASAASQLASALQAQSQLSTGNMTGAAAQLSVATAKFSDALAAASAQVQGSGYSGALSSVKKAEAAFRTSLSSLAWTAVSDAQEQYAKARKAADPAQPYAPTAQKGISGAQSLFAQGDYLGAFVDAAQADADMASADEAVASGDAAASAQEAALASQFASLKQETDSLLSNYSSEYSVLSSQSKRQLPTTPSALRGQIDDAAKAMAAASKPGVAPRQALEQANASYQSIAAAHKLVSDSLEQVRSLAQSSLEVARTAAAQAAKQPGADASQIAGEVSRAEEFYSNALYADSLVSSENAISAANLLLSQNSGGLDVRAVLIACASLAFIAAAAWFFLRGGRGGKKKEKKELPKAES